MFKLTEKVGPMSKTRIRVGTTASDYRLIAREAYDNATDLRADARFLLEKNSPRAFAVSVACVEELMKAYMADLVSKGGAQPKDLKAEFDGRKWPMLTHHGSKQRLFALFLLMQAAKKEGPEKMASVDKTLRETLSTDAVDVKGKNEILELINRMEERRQASLYVDIKVNRGKLQTPKKSITRVMSEDLLKKIDEFLPIVETNLKISAERYRAEVAKLEDERRRQVRS